MKGRRQRHKPSLGAAVRILAVLLCSAMVYAACVGSANISMGNAIRLLVAKIPVIGGICDISGISDTHKLIVYQVRLPRIILSGLTGMGLAVTGAAFQGLFQNPLADPHILGVSSGAALGATAALLSGMNARFLGLGLTGMCAFGGGLAAVFLVCRIAGFGDSAKSVRLLLTGTAISSLLSAVISFLMARNREDMGKIYMWTLGSFSAATWEKTGFLLAFLAPSSVCLLILGRELNLLSAGEDTAKTLGVSVKAVRWAIILAGTFLTSACVSVSGIIGFAGLIIPHCVRLVLGADHGRVLPCAMLAGAVFMIVCDTLARTAAAPSEIPVGVVTAFFGAPYFLFLIYRERRA